MNATLYQHIDFAGAALELSGDTPDLRSKGAQWNDQASSVKVPAGGTVILFQDINFSGQQLKLTSDAPDLRAFPGPGADGTWNDVASSVKVVAADSGGGSNTRLKQGGLYVECKASGAVTTTAKKGDGSRVVVTRHDDKKYDAAFQAAGGLQLSVQNDGTLQSRPAGQYGPFEALDAITAPDPSGVSLLFRTDNGHVVGGTVLEIVEEA